MMDVKAPARYQHGNLKQALVDYALAAADDGALDTLSLRKASRDLGVSPGAAYRHFADKESLLRTVAGRGFDSLADRFEAALPFGTEAGTEQEARDRFTNLAFAYLTFSQDHAALWRLMFSPIGTAAVTGTERPSTYDWLGKSLREMAGFGTIRDPDPSLQFFAWTAIHGLSDLAKSPAARRTDSKTLVEDQCRLIIRALSGDTTEGRG